MSKKFSAQQIAQHIESLRNRNAVAQCFLDDYGDVNQVAAEAIRLANREYAEQIAAENKTNTQGKK